MTALKLHGVTEGSMLKWATVLSAYVNSFYCTIQSMNSTEERKVIFCTDLCGGQTT